MRPAVILSEIAGFLFPYKAGFAHPVRSAAGAARWGTMNRYDSPYRMRSKKMEAKLYVGNLSYETTEDELRTLFAQVGPVTSVDLIKDRDTGSSKGFAFVTFTSQEDANKAIQQLNGRSLGNRELKVNLARPREERPGGFGGGNRGGGYGGNSRGRSGGGGGGGDRRY
jgi:RNA recognition motif-containing protein